MTALAIAPIVIAVAIHCRWITTSGMLGADHRWPGFKAGFFECFRAIAYAVFFGGIALFLPGVLTLLPGLALSQWIAKVFEVDGFNYTTAAKTGAGCAWAVVGLSSLLQTSSSDAIRSTSEERTIHAWPDGDGG